MRENAKLKEAKTLRSSMTDAEQRLWYYLRAKRFYGLKFRRQAPVEQYIPDFVCMHPPLIVELDGGQHAMTVAKDARRDTILRKRGFTVLRFWNNEVLGNIEAVLMVIKQHIDNSSLSHPLPGPLPHAGEGEMRNNG